MVDIQTTSLMLQFLTRCQTGIPTRKNATCSNIQNTTQYNCSAETTIFPLAKRIQLVNVTVSGPYGSNSSSVVEIEQSKHTHYYNTVC